MEISKETNEGKSIYHISGRVDTQTAPDLQIVLDKGFAEGEKDLTLDFSGVEYLSSAGLRTILYAQKRINALENAKMTIINVKPDIMEVFDMTGFTDFLTINPVEDNK